jgi:P-type Mg2+ transporter
MLIHTLEYKEGVVDNYTVVKSQPEKYLFISTLLIGIVTLILPFTPLAGLFGFVPLPILFVLVLGAIVIIYIAADERLKQTFYQRSHF